MLAQRKTKNRQLGSFHKLNNTTFNHQQRHYYGMENDGTVRPREENFRRRLQSAYNRVQEFSSLEENWDGNGALPFTDKLIKTVEKILKQIKYSPEVFPTERQSIQLEFEKSNDDYLEFEVFENKIVVLVDFAEMYEEYVIDHGEFNKVNNLLESFYKR